MDDWAASQQLIQEEAQSARSRRFHSPPASYSLADLQAYADDRKERDPPSSAWPASPLKRFALRSASAARDILVPDSQAEPTSAQTPPMSQTLSTQAVPASSAPNKSKKGRKKTRPEPETANTRPDGEAAGDDPSLGSSQPQRKRKLPEHEAPASPANATPAEEVAASPQGNTETPPSAKRPKRIASKGARAWKRKSMDSLRNNNEADTAQAENGDAEPVQSQAADEENEPKPTKTKKPRRPGKQVAPDTPSAVESPPATQDELPDASADAVELVESLAMEDEPILPGNLLEDLKTNKSKSQSKRAEQVTSTPVRPAKSSQKNTPASESKTTAALQSSSTKDKSKKRKKSRKSTDAVPNEQESAKEIADTPEPVSEEQESTAQPVQDDSSDQQQAQAELQDHDDVATPSKASDSDEREGKKSHKKKKADKALDTYDWTAPPVRNVDEPPEETPSYEGLEEPEAQGSDEKKTASTPRASKTKSNKESNKESKKQRKKARGTQTPRKNRRSLPPSEQYRRAVEDDGLTQAERALERERELHHPPDLRKNGDFTEDEQEIVRRAIRDYQERKGLSTHELVSIIQYTHDYKDTANAWAEFRGTQAEEQEKQESLEFWGEMKEMSLKRDFPTIRGHIRSQYHTFRTGRWTDEETEQLRSLHAANPGQWKLISHSMGTRSLSDVFNRWRDYEQFGDSRIINRWSEEEEKNLVRVLSLLCQRDEDQRAELGRPPLAEYTNSDINWAQVCIELGNTRSRIQCQQKWSRMKTRTPPATIQIEIKPRDPSVVYDESKHRRKSGVKQGSGDGEGGRRRQSRKKREPVVLGEEHMLWGDKFDLVAAIIERTIHNGLADEDQIDWDAVSADMDNKWPAAVLETVFTKLLAGTDRQDNLSASVGLILADINENHSGEIHERYEAVTGTESADEEAMTPSSSKKRRRRSEGKSVSGKKKRRTDARQSTSKARSKAFITASDDESEHEA
jgi:hypothetical protein